jgi:hypothetical protein
MVHWHSRPSLVDVGPSRGKSLTRRFGAASGYSIAAYTHARHAVLSAILMIAAYPGQTHTRMLRRVAPSPG